ncbi:MAG: DNA polymerase III subunit delta [Paramuribaculum sp.]|nr:DNA polymerase III subunit delta [Paramuribaculum sp.]
MKFSDIPGQEQVKAKLKALADTSKIPHALLLEGPGGVGKYALARAFAQYIHCKNHIDGDSCGVCSSCVRHQALTDIDTHFVFPVIKREKDTKAPISDDFRDEWNEYLRDRLTMDFDEWTKSLGKVNGQPITYVTESEALLHKLSYASRNGGYKIVVWWLPEKMKIEAANKLLKMIEEPFDDTLFILTSDNPENIIPTIYSRLQRISVPALPDNVVSERLQAYGIDPKDAAIIARNSRGNLTAAINALDSLNDEKEYLDYFIRLMRLAYQRKVAELREWANDLASWGREKEVKFYDYTLRLIRENFILNFNLPQLNFLNSAEFDFSRNFARFINERNVEKLIDTFENAKTDIIGNGNGKIVNLDVAIRVILLLKK